MFNKFILFDINAKNCIFFENSRYIHLRYHFRYLLLNYATLSLIKLVIKKISFKVVT
jgi:hypothetical protein